MLHFCVCEHRADVNCQKAPVLSHLSKGHSPRSFVACQYAFWQIPVSFFIICFQQWCPPRSSSMKSTLAQTPTDYAIWHWWTLTLEFTSNLFGSCSGLFGYHSYYPSLHFVINFPHAATSREVGYSPLDFKLLNNMSNCSHMNIKLLGDGLIAFTFNMLVYNFLSNHLKWRCVSGSLLQQLSLFVPLFSV